MRDPGVARPNFTPLSYTKLNSTYLRKTKAFWLPTEHLYVHLKKYIYNNDYQILLISLLLFYKYY